MSFKRPLAAVIAACLWISAAASPALAERVLATAGGHRLTETMAADAAAFAGFLAGEPLTAAERRTLDADLVASFGADPAGETRGFEKLRGILAEVARLHPAEAAARRTRIVTELHWAHVGKPPEALVALAQRHDPVIAADPATRVVVTRSAVRALAASNSFVAGLAGFAPMTPDEIAALEAKLPAALPGLDRRRQGFAADAAARWARLRARWDEVSPKDREAVRAAVRAAVDTRDRVPDAARELEQIVENRHLRAVNAAALRDFMQAGALMTLPSVMMQQVGSFN
jgi:hypothetical protein